MTSQTTSAPIDHQAIADRLDHLVDEHLLNRGLAATHRIRFLVKWPLFLLPAAIFGQLVTPHPVWLALIVALISLYSFSYLWARGQLRNVDFERRRQGTVLVAGDLLREDFELRNHGRWPVLWCALIDFSDLPGYAPGSVVACNVGGKFHWWKEAECAHRGVFHLGPHLLRFGEPFGLFVAEIRSDHSETVLIYPRVVQLPQVDLPRGAAGGSTPRRRPLFGVQPAVSVRDYVLGDSTRYVHWPTSAHRGHLMVKELELEPSGDVWIVLDLYAAAQRGAGREGTLEHGIILAASIAAEMVSGQDRRTVGLLTASGEEVIALPPQPGQAQLWAIMAALAPAQASPWPLADLLRRNRRALGRRHTLLVITPAMMADPSEAEYGDMGADTSMDWVAELVQLQRQGLASSVLLVSQPEDEPAHTAIELQLNRLEIPAQILRTDMKLRAALTYRRKRKIIRTTPTGGAFTVEVEEEVG